MRQELFHDSGDNGIECLLDLCLASGKDQDLFGQISQLGILRYCSQEVPPALLQQPLSINVIRYKSFVPIP